MPRQVPASENDLGSIASTAARHGLDAQGAVYSRTRTSLTGLYVNATPRRFTGSARLGSASSSLLKLVHRQNAPPSTSYVLKSWMRLSNEIGRASCRERV